jgi:hypothetical protein
MPADSARHTIADTSSCRITEASLGRRVVSAARSSGRPAHRAEQPTCLALGTEDTASHESGACAGPRNALSRPRPSARADRSRRPSSRSREGPQHVAQRGATMWRAPTPAAAASSRPSDRRRRPPRQRFELGPTSPETVAIHVDFAVRGLRYAPGRRSRSATARSGRTWSAPGTRRLRPKSAAPSALAQFESLRATRPSLQAARA